MFVLNTLHTLIKDEMFVLNTLHTLIKDEMFELNTLYIHLLKMNSLC